AVRATAAATVEVTRAGRPFDTVTAVARVPCARSGVASRCSSATATSSGLSSSYADPTAVVALPDCPRSRVLSTHWYRTAARATATWRGISGSPATGTASNRGVHAVNLGVVAIRQRATAVPDSHRVRAWTQAGRTRNDAAGTSARTAVPADLSATAST